MGANTHPTTDVDCGMEAKRERLMADLRENEHIDNVRRDTVADNGVVFKSHGSLRGDIPSDVLAILAEHDAFLPGTNLDASNEHTTLIHTEE